MSDERFQQVEDQYYRLRGQLVAGRLTRDQFEAALQNLVFEDSQGRRWMLGTDSGEWHVNAGNGWVRADPPGAAAPSTDAGLIARFQNAEDEYFKLKGQLGAGRITHEQFEAALTEAMVEDNQGRYWIIGVDSGKWFVREGDVWVEATPPGMGAAEPSPQLDPRFQKTEDEYFKLKGRLGAGRITREQFEAALKDALVQDDQGRYWMLGTDSGKWFVYEGGNWVEGVPPSVASIQ